MQTYCTPEQVTDRASQFGFSLWSNIPHEDQLYITYQTTLDIEWLHGRKRDSGVPFMIGDYDIEDAAIDQCLFLARTYKERRLAEKTKTETDGSKSVGSFSISAKEENFIVFDPSVKRRLETLFSNLPVDPSSIRSREFVRG